MAEQSDIDDKHYQVALNNCANEPIHIPRRVQSFGAVIGYSMRDGEVTHATDNLGEIAGLDGTLLGRTISDVISERILHHEINGVIGLHTIRQQRERLGQFQINQHKVDAAVHVVDSSVVLELERDDWAMTRPGNSISQVRSMLAFVKAASDVDGLLQSGCGTLRRLTGFDRVMGYRFLPGGDGEVVVEAKTPNVAPFVGLRYPASDIPQQVREAMLKMPFRCIADINSTPADLLKADHTSDLDLTLTHLKGVSPIHIEYLQNMGVRSTINLPLIVRGELWGLFALHNGRPRLPSPSVRGVCELFGHFCSLEVQQRLEAEAVSHRRQSISLLRSLQPAPEVPFDLPETINRRGNELIKMIDADGVALISAGQVTSFGSTPNDRRLQRLSNTAMEEVFAVDRASAVPGFSADDPEFGGSAGILSLQLAEADGTSLLFFRDEEVSRVRWGGNPEKRIEFGPNGPRLHPRASFDEYIEIVRGRCRPWRLSQIEAATELRTSLIEILFQDAKATSDQWRKQKEFQDLLIAELNHRVKNVLALVRSIARQTKSSAVSLQQFTESFEQRIAALATAHDLVGGSGRQWAQLRDIIETELRPYAQSESKISINGPQVLLKSDVAPVMALVIHELVTNAAKHGAIGDSSGRLEISWTERSGGVELEWTEHTEQELPASTGNGFGLTLIRRAIPNECQGESTVKLDANGLTARFWLPYENARSAKSEPAPMPALPKENRPEATTVESLTSALVVEDNMVLSMEMESMLHGIGCRDVYSAGHVREALDLVKDRVYSIAVLDINLAGEDSFQVAEALMHRNVPFLFVTGYGQIATIPPNLEHITRLSKPVDQHDLNAAILQLLDRQGS